MRAKKDDRPKIVIIDDEPDFLDVMERSLKSLYRVTALYGSQWTYAQIEELEPDLVLLDIHMPEESGLELCRRLRADPKFADTPVLFLTASRTNADFRGHLAAGGTRFLNKDLDRRKLLEILAEEIQGARA